MQPVIVAGHGRMPPSEQSPEQSGESDNSLDMEIAPATPFDSETRDGVAARLASWNEYEEDWRGLLRMLLRMTR